MPEPSVVNRGILGGSIRGYLAQHVTPVISDHSCRNFLKKLEFPEYHYSQRL
jgi:hypothetical protein